MPDIDRVLIHLQDYRRLPIDPAKVFFLEAEGDQTLIRTHSKKVIHDLRSLGEIESLFEPHQFIRKVDRWYETSVESKGRRRGSVWGIRK